MSGGLQSFLKSVDVKIGWGRVGFLLSLTIITISGIVLYRMLREINFEDVIDAVEAVEKHNVVKAAMFVAAGYFTLTFYDLFALRTIGRPDIPYRVAALAGFTSYAVGHNVGASAFTGGAVAARFGSVRRFNTHPQVRPIAELDQGEEPGLPGDGAGARKAVVLKSPVPRGWRGERRRCSALRLRWIAAIIFSKALSSPPRCLVRFSRRTCS
jgi:hypothetical protein